VIVGWCVRVCVWCVCGCWCTFVCVVCVVSDARRECGVDCGFVYGVWVHVGGCWCTWVCVYVVMCLLPVASRECGADCGCVYGAWVDVGVFVYVVMCVLPDARREYHLRSTSQEYMALLRHIQDSFAINI